MGPQTMGNVSSIIAQLKAERDKVAKQLWGMDAALRAFAGVYGGATNGTRQISTVGRKRITAAQRAGWATSRKPIIESLNIERKTDTA
jgi:hypothetical protein